MFETRVKPITIDPVWDRINAEAEEAVAREPLGILENTLEANILLYPNPTNGILNVRLNTPLAAPIAMTVFDVLGKRVYSASLNLENTALNMGSLGNGVYAAVFKSGQDLVVKRIVLE